MDGVQALKLDHVSKRFGALAALEDVSFQLAVGERRAVLGPNGAGKTTLFHVISGVLPPTAGRIELFGRDVTTLPTQRRIALGMGRTFQITNLFPKLTVEQNLVLALQGLTKTKLSMLKPLGAYHNLLRRTDELLDQWRLEHRRSTLVKELSYGEQRSLEILMAVSQHPKLLLLDEPTAGLSPAETAQAADLVHNLPRDITILLIEHDMDVAFQLCDTLTVMHLGQVVATGPKEEVRQNPQVQAIYLGIDEAV